MQSDTKDLALVTGASGGIGAAIARELAALGHPLLLVARNPSALANEADRLGARFGVAVRTLALDLATDEGVDGLIRDSGIDARSVGVLVNNAGFGDYKLLVEQSAATTADLIRLNSLALTRLTHHFARAMVQQGRGRILNVASTAGLQPGPGFAVYSATKAFVVSFSEALHHELRGTGVSCTVLSPGVTDTGFKARAGMQHARLFKSGVMSADAVAQTGVAALLRGKLHVVPGWRNRAMAALSMMTPSRHLRLGVAARILASDPPAGR